MQVEKTQQTQTVVWDRQQLLHLIWPLILERFLMVSLGIVDTLMVATLNEASVSGVSLVDSINLVLNDVLLALSTGGAVVCSQYLGRKDRENASHAAKQLIYVVTIASVAVAGVLFFSHGALLSLIYGNIEADVMSSAKIYFLISAIGYPFLALYNAGAALFRSMGNSRVGMAVSMVNLLNIGGNALFMFVFGWGVAGAALSTLACRVISTVVIFVLLFKNNGAIQIHGLLKFRIRRKFIGSIMHIGIPAGIENGLFQIGKLVMARLVTSFGTEAIAGNAIANTLLSIGNIPGMAIQMAVLTVIGQCIGARAFDSAKKYIKDLVRLSYITMSVLNAALLCSISFILSFLSLSEAAAKIAINCTAIFCIFAIFIWTPSFCMPQALRAAGDGKFTMVVSTAAMWTIRVAGGYLLAGLGLGVYGIWCAMIVEWAIRSGIFLGRWRGGKWMTKQVIEAS